METGGTHLDSATELMVQFTNNWHPSLERDVLQIGYDEQRTKIFLEATNRSVSMHVMGLSGFTIEKNVKPTGHQVGVIPTQSMIEHLKDIKNATHSTSDFMLIYSLQPPEVILDSEIYFPLLWNLLRPGGLVLLSSFAFLKTSEQEPYLYTRIKPLS